MSHPLSFDDDQRFEQYMDALAEAIGHQHRAERLRGYCTGLLLPGERKSIEPIAARVAPDRARIMHQNLHHFIADGAWSDAAVLAAVRAQVLPSLVKHGPIPRPDPTARSHGPIPRPDPLLDRRRHRHAEDGHALGRRGAPLLRRVGQG